MTRAQPLHPSLTAAQVVKLTELYRRCTYVANAAMKLRVLGPNGSIPDLDATAAHVLELQLAMLLNEIDELGALGVVDAAQIAVSRDMFRIAKQKGAA